MLHISIESILYTSIAVVVVAALLGGLWLVWFLYNARRGGHG